MNEELLLMKDDIRRAVLKAHGSSFDQMERDARLAFAGLFGVDGTTILVQQTGPARRPIAPGAQYGDWECEFQGWIHVNA